jgi:hypothetical protein
LIRWSEFFLRQFCFPLDHCRIVLNGTRFFPFTLELFTLLFERVHASRPIVPHFPAKPIIDARMCIWGKLFPKKGQLEFPIIPVGRDVCDLLASKDSHFLDIL